MDETKRQLWAVIYDNNYGHDSSFYSSEANALAGACCIIMDWLGEVLDEQVREGLKQLFLAGSYVEMLTVWGGYQAEHGTETLTIKEADQIDAGIRNLESYRQTLTA